MFPQPGDILLKKTALAVYVINTCSPGPAFSSQVIYPAGADASQYFSLRRLIPQEKFTY